MGTKCPVIIVRNYNPKLLISIVRQTLRIGDVLAKKVWWNCLLMSFSPDNPVKDDLFKMKVNDLKNTIYFVNDGMALIQVQSQIVSRSGLYGREQFAANLSILINNDSPAWRFRLNEETFTAFIEFTRRNCGAPFVKAFANGGIDVQVLDVPESEGSGTHRLETIKRMTDDCLC